MNFRVTFLVLGACVQPGIVPGRSHQCAPDTGDIVHYLGERRKDSPDLSRKAILIKFSQIGTSPAIEYRIKGPSAANPMEVQVAGTFGDWLIIEPRECLNCKIRLYAKKSMFAIVAKRDVKISSTEQGTINGVYVRSGTPVSYPNSLSVSVQSPWGEGAFSATELAGTFAPSLIPRANESLFVTQSVADLVDVPCSSARSIARVDKDTRVSVFQRHGDYVSAAIEDRGYALIGFLRTDSIAKQGDQSSLRPVIENFPQPKFETEVPLEPGVCLFAGLTGEVIGHTTSAAAFPAEASLVGNMMVIGVTTEFGVVRAFIAKDVSDKWHKCGGS